jgi:16S rRNA (guanine966-N2)-methyltransferase
MRHKSRHSHNRGGTPVRVIAGALKGRVLRYPDTRDIRPTMLKTKASIFDSLGDRVRGSVFVDLYAAAGGMGIEAASRGAKFVHFVENDRYALRALEENLERCGIGPASRAIHPLDVFDYLARTDPAALSGAILFADPPYAENAAREVLACLEKNGYHQCGLLLIEHEGELVLGHGSPFAVLKSARFGQTRVSFIIPREDN